MSMPNYSGTPFRQSLLGNFLPVSDPSPATLRYKNTAPSDRYGYRRSAFRQDIKRWLRVPWLCISLMKRIMLEVFEVGKSSQ